MARALRILLIDDDENDITLIQMAAKSIGGGHRICSVDQAEKAIELLQDKDRKKLPLPDLVLIDLRMPVMDGFQFLAWLQEHPKFRTLPAIVLSGSMLEEDLREAYCLGARSYLTKPVRFSDLVGSMRSLFSFWSECELPNRPAEDSPSSGEFGG